MSTFMHSRLIAIAALTLYSGVYVGAAALHHHQGPDQQLGSDPSASHFGIQFRPSDLGDDDDHDHCVLCTVLHLAQRLPDSAHVSYFASLTSKALSACPLFQPQPFAAATRARSPPAV
jgi:hypothetical protein